MGQGRHQEGEYVLQGAEVDPQPADKAQTHGRADDPKAHGHDHAHEVLEGEEEHDDHQDDR